MVRLSGALDIGVDEERERRQRLPPTNDISFDARRENGSVNRRLNNFNLPIPNSRRSNDALSWRTQEANSTRGVQHLTNEHDNSGGRRDRGFPIEKTTQVKNQERLRPKLLTAIPRIVKQESIEMEPLLSDSIPQPSTLSPKRKDNKNHLHSNKIRTDSNIMASQAVVNRRNLHTQRESKVAVPRQYNDVFIDGEEDDIVCCDDGCWHEGTKNICTIFIWAAVVFFIMNRFFLHMSMYLHQGEESIKEEVGIAGGNVTLPG